MVSNISSMRSYNLKVLLDNHIKYSNFEVVVTAILIELTKYYCLDLCFVMLSYKNTHSKLISLVFHTSICF